MVWLWGGCVVGTELHLAGEALPGLWCLIFGSQLYFSGSRDWGIGVWLWLSLTCGAWSVGLLGSEARMRYGGFRSGSFACERL